MIGFGLGFVALMIGYSSNPAWYFFSSSV